MDLGLLGIIQEWGPETLLTAVVLMLMSGLLVPSRTVKKLVDAKDKTFSEMEVHYKNRMSDLKEVHIDVTGGLRHTIDVNSQALNVSVDNVRKLVDQQDELLDLARTAAPALIAQRTALESANGQG